MAVIAPLQVPVPTLSYLDHSWLLMMHFISKQVARHHFFRSNLNYLQLLVMHPDFFKSYWSTLSYNNGSCKVWKVAEISIDFLLLGCISLEMDWTQLTGARLHLAVLIGTGGTNQLITTAGYSIVKLVFTGQTSRLCWDDLLGKFHNGNQSESLVKHD